MDPAIYAPLTIDLGDRKLDMEARIEATDNAAEFWVFIHGIDCSGRLVYNPVAWKSTITERGENPTYRLLTDEQINREVVPQVIRRIIEHQPFLDALENFRQASIVRLEEVLQKKEQEVLDAKVTLEAFRLRGPYEPGVGAEGQIYDFLVDNGLAEKIGGRHKIFREDILERKD